MCLRCFDRALQKYFHSSQIFLDSRGRKCRSLAQRSISEREWASRTTRKLLIAGQLKLAQVTILLESAFPERFLGETSPSRIAAVRKILFPQPKKTFPLFFSLHLRFVPCSYRAPTRFRIGQINEESKEICAKERFLKLVKIHRITTWKLRFAKNRPMRKTRPHRSGRYYEIIFRSTAKQEVISVARTKLLWDYSSRVPFSIDRSMSP